MKIEISKEEVREARKKIGYTQAELASVFNISPTTVYYWEKEGRGLHGGTTRYALNAFFEKKLGEDWKSLIKD